MKKCGGTCVHLLMLNEWIAKSGYSNTLPSWFDVIGKIKNNGWNKYTHGLSAYSCVVPLSISTDLKCEKRTRSQRLQHVSLFSSAKFSLFDETETTCNTFSISNWKNTVSFKAKCFLDFLSFVFCCSGIFATLDLNSIMFESNWSFSFCCSWIKLKNSEIVWIISIWMRK